MKVCKQVSIWTQTRPVIDHHKLLPLTNKYFFTLLALTLLFTACPDDDEPTFNLEPALNASIVTGLQARDINGAPIGQFGNPNVLNSTIEVFPNPALGEIAVQQTANEGLAIKQFWLISAQLDTTFADINYGQLLSSELYSVDELSADAIISDSPAANSFAIATSGLSGGYYRIFYQLANDQLFWDNIYIDPGAANLTVLLERIQNDW